MRKAHQPDGRWALQVDRAESGQAIGYLERVRALPMERRQPERSNGWLTSRAEQQQRLERKIAESLEETLYSLDQVREARVHLNLPQRDALLGKELTPGSASVLLVYEGHAELSSQDIAKLVAGAAGIRADQVAVLQSGVTPITSEIYDREIASPTSTSSSHLSPLTKRENSSDPFGKKLSLGTELALTLVLLGCVGVLTIWKHRVRPLRPGFES